MGVRSRSALALMILLVTASAWAATPVYVDKSAPGAVHSGTSWQTAFVSISQALASMPNGGEIRVKAGTYHESLTLKAYTKIYGGFIGFETTPDQRLAGAFPTIISGDRKWRVIDTPANSRITLDGLTIRDGRADRGAGVRCGTSTVIDMSNCRVEACVATDRAGGIYLGAYVTGHVEDCVVTRNEAGRGGGMVVEYHCYPLLDRLVITRNHATISGGGVFCPFHSGALLTNCTLAYNSADLNAGAVYAYYGGPETLNYCIVAFNTAPAGGGLFADGGSPSVTLAGCDWYGNSVGDVGGELTSLPPNSGNFKADPMFLMPEADEFHLSVGSPCAGVGAFPLSTVYPVDRIGVAKLLGNGVAVKLTNKIVSAVEGNTGYVQETDRSSGMAVRGLTDSLPGQVVTFSGVLSSSGAHTFLDASSVSVCPNANYSSEPMGCRISWLDSLSGVCTRTWGRVDAMTPSGFSLRDGQSVAVVRALSSAARIGDFVTVTGVYGIDGVFLASEVRVLTN